MDRVLLTVKGADKLQAELKNLKSVERSQVIADIAEARAHGDLSENAEYSAAKERQGFIEGRIKELESQLSIAEIIDPTKLDGSDKVLFGATVLLYDGQKEAEIKYQLVGDLEANIDENKISISSPLGRALIGKYEGDVVDFNAPAGLRSYEVLAISY